MKYLDSILSISLSLRLLLQLFSFSETDFPGRMFTTGATASNLLGMALGREFVVAEAGRRNSPPSHISVAELGVVEACIQAGISNIQVLAARQRHLPLASGGIPLSYFP